MLRRARTLFPAIGAVEADMRALPIRPGCLAGLIAFYSFIHLRRDEAVPALLGFWRALAPGGRLLVAVHAGEGEVAEDEFLGHAVHIEATLFGADELAGMARVAGFLVDEVTTRPPYPQERTHRVYLAARAVR
jgi:SAM-dependent methyltransferase